MSFYKEIAPFIDYIHSIRKLKTYISFDMVFPTKWSMPKSMLEEGETVAFQAEDQNYKGISFVSQIDEVNVSIVLTKIAKVIKLNQERELKEKLFKQTVESQSSFLCSLKKRFSRPAFFEKRCFTVSY